MTAHLSFVALALNVLLGASAAVAGVESPNATSSKSGDFAVPPQGSWSMDDPATVKFTTFDAAYGTTINGILRYTDTYPVGVDDDGQLIYTDSSNGPIVYPVGIDHGRTIYNERLLSPEID
jgi:hypothetical protein